MSQISVLIRKLDQQISDGDKVAEFIDELQMFVSQREGGANFGLKEKLEHVGRGEEVQLAFSKKELFDKQITKLEHYSSAQLLFVYFLSRIHEVFEAFIMNQGRTLSRREIEDIVEKKIVAPTLAELDDCGGSDHLFITQSHIRGMIFWLADRCWVRWH